MDNSQNNDYTGPATTTASSSNGTIQTKPKRQSISYKTEWQKSSERADKLSRWALIGWALAIIEGVWLVILISV